MAADAPIRLLTPDLPTLDAALKGPEALSRALGGCLITDGWLDFPDALPRVRDTLAADPGHGRWGARLFLLRDPPALAGWGGFKGPPAAGTVELGYAIAPGLRGRGLATAAVREMLQEAFAAREVRSVSAHTRPGSNPSTRALEKTGFRREGEATQEGIGEVWRWRRDRP